MLPMVDYKMKIRNTYFEYLYNVGKNPLITVISFINYFVYFFLKLCPVIFLFSVADLPELNQMLHMESKFTNSYSNQKFKTCTVK